MANRGEMRADCGFQAVQGRLTRPSCASHLRNGRKIPENSPGVRHRGALDVRIGGDLGLERFQAQPKWEIPVKRYGEYRSTNTSRLRGEKYLALADVARELL